MLEWLIYLAGIGTLIFLIIKLLILAASMLFIGFMIWWTLRK